MIDITAIGAADARRLREVRLRALADSPAAFAATVEEEAALPPSHWEELARQSEIADHVAIYVAVRDENWIGLAAGRWFHRERAVAQLWSMWVDPAGRRSGTGERLVAAVRGWAVQQGAQFLRLGVIAREGDATPFYESLGFVRTGEVRQLRREPSRLCHFLVRPL